MTLAEPADSFSEPDVSKAKEKPPTAKKGNMEICVLDTFFCQSYIEFIDYVPPSFSEGKPTTAPVKKGN